RAEGAAGGVLGGTERREAEPERLDGQAGRPEPARRHGRGRAPGAVADYSFNTLSSMMSGDSARMASRAACGGALSRWTRATAADAPSKTTFSVSWTLMPACLSWLKTAESTPTRS